MKGKWGEMLDSLFADLDEAFPEVLDVGKFPAPEDDDCAMAERVRKLRAVIGELEKAVNPASEATARAALVGIVFGKYLQDYENFSQREWSGIVDRYEKIQAAVSYMGGVSLNRRCPVSEVAHEVAGQFNCSEEHLRKQAWFKRVVETRNRLAADGRH